MPNEETGGSGGIFVGEVARRYDERSRAMYTPDVLGPTVDFLANRTGDGRALELASGTGRVALALADRGVAVAGIELSPDMVAEMMRKPGADRVPVTIGDMTSARVDGRFRLVYLVFNAIGNLLTQEAQVECFANAARHLESGGVFVIENYVPQLRRLPPGGRFVPFEVSPGHVGVDEFDVVNQRLVSHHWWVGADGAGPDGSTDRTPQRYTWPAELDLMARLAGMELIERWGGWSGEPFTEASESHVSAWRLP